jgi:hypothetical protein
MATQARFGFVRRAIFRRRLFRYGPNQISALRGSFMEKFRATR